MLIVVMSVALFGLYGCRGNKTKESFTNNLGMVFVYIEPGTFMMGSPESEAGRYSNELHYRVTLTKGFYMLTTEVTQGQRKAVMGSNPSHFSSCGDNCPVETVSWNQVQEFIRELNQREGGTRYRLPTEAAGAATPGFVGRRTARTRRTTATAFWASAWPLPQFGEVHSGSLPSRGVRAWAGSMQKF
jgi:formylglycine-generating enzyme required for sulfatase activity